MLANAIVGVCCCCCCGDDVVVDVGDGVSKTSRLRTICDGGGNSGVSSITSGGVGDERGTRTLMVDAIVRVDTCSRHGGEAQVLDSRSAALL